MRTLGNIIWHIPFLGFLFALAYALGGLFFCITIIGIPIGLGWLQFSLFLLSPFSKAMVSREDLDKLTGKNQTEGMQAFSTIVRILYFPFGLLAAIGALCTIIGEFISILGIPCGIVWAKSLSTIFNPVNKVCVPRAVAMEIERRKDAGTLEKYTLLSTDSSIAEKSEYIERAESKSDDDLKDIIRRKDDYNPKLVNAAEKVLLARMTENEIFEDKPEITFTHNNTFDFTKLKGEVLIGIGILLPLIPAILHLFRNIYTTLSEREMSLGVTLFIDALSVLVRMAGTALIGVGLFNIKKESEKTNIIGIIFVLIGSLIRLFNSILIFTIHDNEFAYDTGTNPLFSMYEYGFNITTIIEALSFTFVLYSLFLVIGVILWKYLNRNAKMDATGALLICLATILNFFFDRFYMNIFEYINGDSYDFSPQMFCLSVIETLLFLFMSIYGWYKFLGIDTQKQKEESIINQ